MAGGLAVLAVVVLAVVLITFGRGEAGRRLVSNHSA